MFKYTTTLIIYIQTMWSINKINWAYGKDAFNFVSAIEAMSTFSLIVVPKSVNLSLTE